MTFTVQFMSREQKHSPGIYDDYEQAKNICRDLVKNGADCAWVEVTQYPELKSPMFLKEKPLPLPLPEVVTPAAPKGRKHDVERRSRS